MRPAFRSAGVTLVIIQTKTLGGTDMKTPSKSLPLVLGKVSMKRRLDKFAEIRRSADA
jgi:hypothetical protein